ncbi:MAG: peptidoglycan-binding protein [Burkholderiaceae bacterium]
MHTLVPRDEVATRSHDLENLGFHVLSVDAVPDRPDMGLIQFDSADPEGLPQTVAVDAALIPTQIATIQGIVNLFETGSVLGDYGGVTVIKGDTGHLTFGRSQTTLGSGNLALMLQQYCANPGARFATRLLPYLSRFAARDLSLDDDQKLHNVLRATADDPVMRETQDQFFDRNYWMPARRAATLLRLRTPLGVAVVYDSHVHGSFALIRDRTKKQIGLPSEAGEQRWISEYVRLRREWLSAGRADLQPTVYRMDCFQRLIDNGQWALTLPLVVRREEISIATLNATPPGCHDGPEPGTRALALSSPLLRGLDVRRVQLALSDRGFDTRADGIFGQASQKLIRAYQSAQGVPATGVLEPGAVLELLAG